MVLLRRMTIFLGLFFFSIGGSWCGPVQKEALGATPQAKVRVQPERVYLGQPLRYLVQITSPVALHFSLPPSGKRYGKFEQIEPVKEERYGAEGLYRWRLSWTLALYEARRYGPQQIPSFSLFYRNDTGHQGKLLLPAVTVELRRRYAPDAPPPITVERTPPLPRVTTKGPPLAHEHRSLLWQETTPWIWGGLSLPLLLLGGGVLWWRLRRRGAATARTPPLLPPAEEALRRLSLLEGSRPATPQEGQAFYQELSEILREYLGRRYGFDAEKQTSSEVLALLQKEAPDSFPTPTFQRWLDACDLVRFAGYQPSTVESQQARVQAIALVEQSRPPAPADDEES